MTVKPFNKSDIYTIYMAHTDVITHLYEGGGVLNYGKYFSIRNKGHFHSHIIQAGQFLSHCKALSFNMELLRSVVIFMTQM